jgi:(heptosyl)LPS beta-1,4-glucosyltransferase
VAVDSCSTDGSADLVRDANIESRVVPWLGYGHARAAAVSMLGDCDYVLFLDSDESLDDRASAAFSAWRASSPADPFYGIPVEDWAELDGHRFLFRRRGPRKRVVRRDRAAWTTEMLVHESIPGRARLSLGTSVRHLFASDLAVRREKELVYAVLWAVQAHVTGRRRASGLASTAAGRSMRRAAHTLKALLLDGALWRGGGDAVRLARVTTRYHVEKHVWLSRLSRGEHAELVAALERGDVAGVFERARSLARVLAGGD